MLLKKLSLCLSLALILSGCTSNLEVKVNNNKPSFNDFTAETSSNKLITVGPPQNTPIGKSVSTPIKPPPTPTAMVEPKELSNSFTKEFSNSFTPIKISNYLSLDSKKIEWSWMYSPKINSSLLSKYHGYAFGDNSSKIIYLTFDEGYENGYTSSILDTLKTNNVKAAFFVTEPFVTSTLNGVKNITLLRRIYNEGHLICNHSVHHQSMPSFKDENTFNKELTGVESLVDNIPGLRMSKFFRPPMGDFSELSLYYTQQLGYKSIFFALAYNDWDPNNQPDPVKAKQSLLKDSKPGMICLLHALSKTNASILDSLIKEWKAEGYKFKTLNELP